MWINRRYAFPIVAYWPQDVNGDSCLIRFGGEGDDVAGPGTSTVMAIYLPKDISTQFTVGPVKGEVGECEMISLMTTNRYNSGAMIRGNSLYYVNQKEDNKFMRLNLMNARCEELV